MMGPLGKVFWAVVAVPYVWGLAALQAVRDLIRPPVDRRGPP